MTAAGSEVPPKHFLLIHGAWHDGRAWDAVAELMRAEGHVVHAPTLPGHGPDADRRVTHALGVEALREYVEASGLERFVLVAHSLGGTYAAKLAEVLPERIERLVFQSAFILADGESMLDRCPPDYRTNFLRLAQRSGEDSISLPYALWRQFFVNDAEEPLARRTHALLSPQPLWPCAERLYFPRFFALGLPTSVIHCRQDLALPPGQWGWHPAMSRRLGAFRLLELEGGHEVMYTDPEGLAEAILAAC